MLIERFGKLEYHKIFEVELGWFFYYHSYNSKKNDVYLNVRVSVRKSEYVCRKFVGYLLKEWRVDDLNEFFDVANALESRAALSECSGSTLSPQVGEGGAFSKKFLRILASRKRIELRKRWN